ncbi:MAG: hypothetical protein OHK0056_12330 [Bacteriovoracaceae bacterium]
MKLEANTVLTIFAPGVLAGAERVVIAGLNTFARELGHAQVILIKEKRNPSHVENFVKMLDASVQIEIVETSWAFDLLMPQKLKKLIDTKFSEALIIHTHGYKALLFSSIIRLPQYRVHTHHGNTSHTFKVKLYESMAQYFMRFCHGIITLSRPMYDQFKFIGAKKVAIIPNMLLMKNFNKIQSFRQQRQLGQKINLLYLGRLSKEKGVLDLLMVFKNLPNKESLDLHIVGDGPLMDKAKQISSDAVFHGHQNDPSQFLMNADVLILPSHSEGMPISMMEALSLGIIVLANPVGAIPDYIQSPKLLMKIGNDEIWKNGFLDLEKNFEYYRKLAIEKSDYYQKQFSPQNWFQRISDFYQSIV